MTDGCKDLRDLRVPVTSRQEHLHAIVEALYRGKLEIEPVTVEELLRIADFLGMQCISEACQKYISDFIVEAVPVEVHLNSTRAHTHTHACTHQYRTQ